MTTIEFKDNVGILDLSTLKETATYEMAKGGLPRSRPIEHAQLIEDIVQNIQDNTTLNAEVQPIYINERQAMRVMWRGEKEDCPVENYLIQRLITEIKISTGSGSIEGTIGLAYNEHGIQIAFGAHVSTCKNMMIWGDNLMGTYGANKSDWKTIWAAFDDWMKTYKEKFQVYLDGEERMKKTRINEKDLFAFLGKLIYRAERANFTKGNGNSLNVSQTLRLIDNFEMAKVKKSVTVWDIVQFGTENLKPDKDARDLTQLFGTTKAYCDFALQELCPN